MLEVLDILISIIFREADPSLSYAIEPISLALMAGGALFKALRDKGAGDISTQGFLDQAAAMQDRGAATVEQGREMITDATKRRGDYGLGPSFTDLRRMVMEDPTSDYLKRQALRTEAANLDAMKYGGARSIGANVQSATQQTLDNLSKIAADEQKRKVQGLNLVGAQEQRVAEQKLVDARGDLTYGRGLEAEGLAQQYAGEDAERYGNVQSDLNRYNFGTALGGAAFDIAGQMDFSNLGEKLGGLFGGGGGGNLEWAQRMASEGGGTSGGNVLDLFGGGDPYAQIDIFGKKENGGRVTAFKEGGELMRDQETPGEFSHKNNPIDIMQDGAKIGEMTGGEGIVSPQDMGNWEQEAAKGNTKLHRMIRAWFRKINEQDNE